MTREIFQSQSPGGGVEAWNLRLQGSSLGVSIKFCWGVATISLALFGFASGQIFLDVLEYQNV